MSAWEIDALDDFAGTGWGVACQRLGIRERGVEIMPEVVATREANGMVTIGRDVWEHIKEPAARPWAYGLYIGSPPCQTFSMAGGGKGRQALDEVVGLIDSRAYLDVDALHEFGERHDPRTALVLAPLVRIAHDLPPYIVLEQVPPVLPVWERYADELRKWGYSVWCGILNSEQYGVPQTRKRAVLIARADGIEAAPPTPTHSRYYSHDPKRLDPDVLPWVSMAEALGWGMTARPSATMMTGSNGGGSDPMSGGSGSRAAYERELAAGRWAMRSNYGTGGDPANRGERTGDQPAPTMTSKVDRNMLTFVSNGKLANSARRPADELAPTATAGHDSGNQVWQLEDDELGFTAYRAADERCPSCGDLVDYHDEGGFCAGLCGGHCQDELYGRPGKWNTDDGLPPRVINLDPAKPATTVAADPHLTSREHHNHGEQNSTSTRVTVAEAAALQSYPPDFDWSTGPNGKPLSKTKAFLQIGNAVPPTLAEAILSVFLPGGDS